jgi:hypothetical protein
MASPEIKEALKNVADEVAKYVKDAATLTVQTKTTQVGSGAEATLAAESVIKLDGDNITTLPVSTNDFGKTEVDSVIYEIHMQNVQAAIEYRSKIIQSVIEVLLP